MTVAATGPAYSNIFVKTTGVAATVAAGPIAGGTITDGAAPVIVSGGITFSTPSAATPSLTNVGVTFSEPVTFNTNGTATSNLREILENINVGASTLAELSLNSGVTPVEPAVITTSASNQGVVTVSGVASADVATLTAGVWTGKSISVSRGITFQEINDTNYAANLVAGTTLDEVSGTGPNGEELAGGVKSLSGVVEAIQATAVAQTAVAPAATIAWGTDTSALASASSAAAPDLIDTITVTFAAGKGVKYAPIGTTFGTATALAAAKTATDLAANLVVDVFGSNGVKFQVKPLSATLDTANQITIKVPTALIYNKLTDNGAQLKSVWVGYVADGNNAANNTLVATDAASTLTSPIRVAEGITSTTNGAWVDADKDRAGAEPVVLPLVFTATQTGGQSTLLTQNIQSNIAGSTAGSIVKAYLAYWVDLPTQSIVVAGSDIKSGKITNPGDKVATDLAIEFDNAGALASLIQTELQRVTSAQTAKPGIRIAAAAIPANNIPVYVKLVRSNDAVQTSANTTNATVNSQGYLNARAILATTYAAAKASGTNDHDNTSPIYEVTLNPVTGIITGRLTGNIVIKPSSETGSRGLRFLDANGVDTSTPTVHGSSIVAAKSATGLALPGTANVNLLMGFDPRTADTSYAALNPFVLLTHQDSTGKFTLLTSADPTAGNYMPFTADVTNKAAGVAVRAKTPLSVTDVRELTLPASANWALYGLGNPATQTSTVAADKAFPRKFVGLDTVTGLPKSFWTGDADHGADIAMSIAGNAVGVATELLSDTGSNTGPTLSTIGAANQVKGAVALGWANARGATDGDSPVLGKIYVAQASGPFAPATAAAAPRLAPGWSLVTVPGTVPGVGTFNAATIDAVIKVGAQVGLTGTTLTAAGTGAGLGNGQFSWFAVDGAMPAMTAGDAVFVHAKAPGAL